MLTFFNKLNIFFKTAIISFLVGVILALILMFLFFIGYAEIVLGLIIGIIFGIIVYVINGIIENYQLRSNNYRFSVAFVFIRLVLLIGFMFGMAALYYIGNVHTFNVIAVAGGCFLVELIFILLHLRYKDAAC